MPISICPFLETIQFLFALSVVRVMVGPQLFAHLCDLLSAVPFRARKSRFNSFVFICIIYLIVCSRFPLPFTCPDMRQRHTHSHKFRQAMTFCLQFYLHSLKRRFFLTTNSNELMGGMSVCIDLETSCNLLFKLNAPVSSIHRSITMAKCAVFAIPFLRVGFFSTKQLAYCLSPAIKSLFESSVHSF